MFPFHGCHEYESVRLKWSSCQQEIKHKIFVTWWHSSSTCENHLYASKIIRGLQTNGMKLLFHNATFIRKKTPMCTISCKMASTLNFTTLNLWFRIVYSPRQLFLCPSVFVHPVLSCYFYSQGQNSCTPSLLLCDRLNKWAARQGIADSALLW